MQQAFQSNSIHNYAPQLDVKEQTACRATAHITLRRCALPLVIRRADRTRRRPLDSACVGGACRGACIHHLITQDCISCRRLAPGGGEDDAGEQLDRGRGPGPHPAHPRRQDTRRRHHHPEDPPGATCHACDPVDPAWCNTVTQASRGKTASQYLKAPIGLACCSATLPVPLCMRGRTSHAWRHHFERLF